VYFSRHGEQPVVKGLPFTADAAARMVGIPWGPIHSIQSLVTNLRGGKDVTAQIAASLTGPTPVSAPAIVSG